MPCTVDRLGWCSNLVNAGINYLSTGAAPFIFITSQATTRLSLQVMFSCKACVPRSDRDADTVRVNVTDIDTREVFFRREGTFRQLMPSLNYIPPKKLTYPTLGRGKSSSNMPYQGDMLIPWRVSCLWHWGSELRRHKWGIFPTLNEELFRILESSKSRGSQTNRRFNSLRSIFGRWSFPFRATLAYFQRWAVSFWEGPFPGNSLEKPNQQPLEQIWFPFHPPYDSWIPNHKSLVGKVMACSVCSKILR